MCGIAGIIDLSGAPIDQGLVEQMCEVMARRGPDAQGLQVSSNAVLGHRRLAILDLSEAGNQPMGNHNGSLEVVFNGEIYNHRELRSELEARGYRYRSRTDTESLIYGYEHWGEGLSSRCRGMWAFAIWDTRQKSLYLSRDRMGEKPLFYYHKGPLLAFASSLRALSLAIKNPTISAAAVASLLAYEFIPTEECIYEGVKKLPPAHYLVFDQAGLRLRRFWEIDYRQKLDITLPEAERLVDETLDNAVAEELEADVPVGVFLSGGVDSGYVAALAARRHRGITTITMTVPDSVERDESTNARRIAETHGTTHIEVPLDQSCIRDLPQLLAVGEPLGDSSIIPTAAVAKQARQYLKVVLTGDGGDEGFGGYGKPAIAARALRLSQSPTREFWRLLAPVLKLLSYQRVAPGLRLFRPYGIGAKLMSSAGLEAFVSTYEATPPQVRRMLYGPKLYPLMQRPVGELYIKQLRANHYSSWWDGLLATDLVTRLCSDFLVKVDTATMFHSLESRSPFLDYRLLELSAKLPLDCWMPDGEPKGLLKRLATRYNPREVVYGPKKGFSIPVEQYFLGSWGKLLLELTADGVAAQLGLLDPVGIRNYLTKHHLPCRLRLDRQLFSILSLEIWLRVSYTRHQTPEDLGEQLWLAAQSQGSLR